MFGQNFLHNSGIWLRKAVKKKSTSKHGETSTFHGMCVSLDKLKNEKEVKVTF